MGSPSATLNLPPHLLPWHASGLRHVLGCKPVAQASEGAENGPEPQAISKRPQVFFPQPWARCWQAVPATARIVWTYLELGRDLCGQPSAERRNLFRTLLAHLNWPKGVTAFWPLCCPDGEGLATRPELFWQGCAALAVKHVACFGPEALALLCPGADAAALAHQHGAVTVHILPAPADLLQLLPHDQHLAVDRLKALRF